MAKLSFMDFLTTSPNAFIFQKKIDKTSFGGALFSFYILIMAFISLTYIYDYAVNDKYIIDAMTNINTTYVEKDPSLNTDDNLNPYADFNVTISGDAIIDGQFVLKTDMFGDVITADYNIDDAPIFNLHRMRVDHLYFMVALDCGIDEECSSYFEDIDPSTFFVVSINYTGYKFHHFEDIPLEITEDAPKTLSFEIGFLDTIYEYLYLYWNAIIYKDQKSLFDSFTKRKREYIYGEIKNTKRVSDAAGSKKDFIFYDEETEKFYMPLVTVYLLNEHKEYIEYKRIKIKFLDVIANIGALSSLLKFVFQSILSFYSENFSNYQMVGTILKYPDKIIEPNDQSNKDSTSNQEEKISNVDDYPLLNDSSDENKLSLNESYDNKANNENKTNESSSFSLKKLSIFDFYFNYIYSKCCKKIKNQEILDLTNEIVLQYLSLDYVLYNQIKLENLFRDYKWNDPQLNNIQNNNLIMKLKNIFNDE